MSLITDPDYLIHSIRLNYLRNVDDPYGSRIVTFDPHYQQNDYILDAGLADTERWPELVVTQSAPPSDDEAESGTGGRPTGFPRAGGLKYTTTIMGNRSGGLGMRVNGKRGSVSGQKPSLRRGSIRQEKKMSMMNGSGHAPNNPILITEPIPPTPISSSPVKAEVSHAHKLSGDSVFRPPELVKAKSDPGIGSPTASSILTATTTSTITPMATATSAPQPDHPPPNITIPFIPKFKGAEEMAARRRLRMQGMQNRLGQGGVPVRPPPKPQPTLSWDTSSSESESDEPSSAKIPITPEPMVEFKPEDGDADAEPDSDADDDGISSGSDSERSESDAEADVPDADDTGVVEPDMYDGEFSAGRADMDQFSHSDGISILSGSGASMLSMGGSSAPLNSVRIRSRLSPVRENHHNEEKSTVPSPEVPVGTREPGDSYFEMVTPAPIAKPQKPAKKPSLNSNNSQTSPSNPIASSPSLFAKRPVAPVQPGKSALSAMLASTSTNSASNPFTELYSAISGRSESESMTLRVYFPHAVEPAGKAMELNVRKDVTAEEVIGFALWNYWEEGWKPRLDEGLEGEDDPKWATKCTALGWLLRIAEDDGEVDEDYPAPDRVGKLSKLGQIDGQAFAVLEATTPQMVQNRALDSKIQRRPSRIVIKKKKSSGLLTAMGGGTNGLTVDSFGSGSRSAEIASLLGTSVGMMSSSLGRSTAQGPPLFLRIRIADTADAGHVSTTIQVSGGMYIAEVLDLVCQKRKLSGAQDYALVVDLNGMKILIPIDKTVRSLQGKRDLMLIKKNMLQAYGVEVNKKTGRSTDPNASIFKRNSDIPEQIYSSVFDYKTAYKRYTVYRKVPMLVARSARQLAIDGGYIHIIPQSNKAKNVFDSGKTASYDIKSIVTVQQAGKNSSTFKIVVHRDSERDKRYDFEAESPKIASEIVQTIKSLKAGGPEKSSGTIKNRKSKQASFAGEFTI